MINDIPCKAYSRKKAINSSSKENPHPSLEKKDPPLYQLNNSISGLNDSLGFSTIKDSESIDIKQLTHKEKETDDRSKAKTNKEYNMLFTNNYDAMNKPCLIGKKVTMKGNQVSSGGGSGGGGGTENNKLDFPKEKESNQLFPFTSFNIQGQGNDKQDDMVNYYINYNKNKEKEESNSNSNSNLNSKRECFVNNRKSNTNSNTFSFKNFLSHQLKALPEDSKVDNNNPSNSKSNNTIQPLPQKYSRRDNYSTKLRETVVSEVIEDDDLTPLPVRTEKIHPIAEYEFNQARSAAVFIRKIEYSFHLKSTRLYKKKEREIIYIQRWWRAVLENRNANILRDLIEYELRNSNYFPQDEDEENNFNNYKNLAITVKRITDRNRMRKAFECLYDNFADLAWYNQTCDSVDMIIRAFRNHKAKLKKKSLRRLKYFLSYLYRRVYIRKITQGKNAFESNLDKITKIQAAVAGHLFRNCDKVVTEVGRSYHPYLYFKIKYGNNDKSKAKIANFTRMIIKWKERVIEKRLKRAELVTDRLNKFFYRYYFDFLLTQIIKKTNSIMTIILLKPHRDFLLRILYQNSLQRFFAIWKRDYLDKKRKCILSQKVIKKILAIRVFMPLVKKYKKKVHMISLIKTMTYYFNTRINRNIMKKFKAFQSFYYKAKNKSKHQSLLCKLMRNKTHKDLQHYFTFLRIISINNSKNIFMVNYGLKELSKAIINLLSTTYKKDKEAIRYKKREGAISFLSLIKFFSYHKSLSLLNILISKLPIKHSLFFSIKKWKRQIFSILKTHENKLRNVLMIYKRQNNKTMNKYLFKYFKKTPYHPNKTKNNITKAMNIINAIFNKKYSYDLYSRLRRGRNMMCLALLMKALIEMSKSKISLHKAFFIKHLQLIKQQAKIQQCKSYQMVSLRTKDECKLLLKYYYKWMKAAIKDHYKDREDTMSIIQKEKLKRICLKRIILHQGSLLITIAFSRWKGKAQVKTHNATMRSAMKNKDMKIIVSKKKNEEDKLLRRFWFKWRQVSYQCLKQELNTIEGINKITMFNRKKAFKVLIDFLKTKYENDKTRVINKIVYNKIFKEHNRLLVEFTKWRHSNQCNSIMTSTNLIQECIRKKNKTIKIMYLFDAITKLFNKSTLFSLKLYRFNSLISKIIFTKDYAIQSKRFTQWRLQTLISQYTVNSRSNSSVIKEKTYNMTNEESDNLIRKYIIEIEDQSEHVYQYKSLQYQVYTESVQIQKIICNDEVIDISHLMKHLIQLKEYHQMRLLTSKKRSVFMYWRHSKALPKIKNSVINYISLRVNNENEVKIVNLRKWRKQSKMILLINAVKLIQRQYARYKLIKESKAEVNES